MSMRRYIPNVYFDSAEAGASLVTKEWLKREIAVVVDVLLTQQLFPKDYIGGVYTSYGGEVYGVYMASKVLPNKVQASSKFCTRVLQEQFKCYTISHPIEETQFLNAHLGLYVVKAILDIDICKHSDSKYLDKVIQLSEMLLDQNYIKMGGVDEIFVGRAGYLCAILNLRMRTKTEVLPDTLIKKIMKSILASGRNHVKRRAYNVPLMFTYYGAEYLGAAHGLMGILQMLLSFPHLLDPKDVQDIESTLDWLISIQDVDGNIKVDYSSDPKDISLVHWCHGVTGAVSLFIVAYIYYKKEKFLTAAKKCLNVIWEKGILRKGPGICHGVAGSGYAFLLFYRLTKDEEYLNKALCCAAILRSQEFLSIARTPDNPNSLFEGIAGALCFLCDLIDPMNAQFPLIPIRFPEV